MSARILRSTSISASDSPFIKRLYDSPFARAAALMRVIHSARNSRLRTRRSRNAYWPALMTACFAARKTLRRAL